MMRAYVRNALIRHPILDGLLRRQVWSRIHFPETELRVLDALPRGSIDTAIDIGAALGSYAWVLGRKARQVIAFEPGEIHGRYMEIASRRTNVTLIRAAVGAHSGRVDMYTPGDDNNARHMATLSRANSVINVRNVQIRRVDVVSLDDVVPRCISTSAHVDVIKIDVEGFENAVIDGATNTIGGHFPLVIAEIEVRHNPEYQHVFQVMRKHGYTALYWLDGAYRVLDGDEITALQRIEDLEKRLAGHSVKDSRYINNFVFQHPKSRIRFA